MNRLGEPLVRPAPGSLLFTEAGFVARDALFDQGQPYMSPRAEYLAHVDSSLRVYLGPRAV